MADESDAKNDIVSLSEADAMALDAILSRRAEADTAGNESGNDGNSPTEPDQQRVERVSAVLGLLDHYRPVEPPADLVERTISRVDESRQQARFAQQIADLSGPSLNFGWYELGAVAASLLIMASLALPMMARNQDNARRIACASNVQSAGSALRSYAADYGGVLPRVPVSPGAKWYQVGEQADAQGEYHSNSAHLYLVIRHRYVDPRNTSCPGNLTAAASPDPFAHDWASADETSYSFHNQFTDSPFHLDNSPRMAILADKNPIFNIRPGQPLRRRSDIGANSALHGTRGQNVLTADGAVFWMDRPVMTDGGRPGQDYLWAIRDQSDYQGNETPDEPQDAHLIP